MAGVHVTVLPADSAEVGAAQAIFDALRERTIPTMAVYPDHPADRHYVDHRSPS
jgi:hypothetical protein